MITTGRLLLVLTAILAGGCAVAPHPAGPLAQWEQLGPEGQRSLRAIVAAGSPCPTVETATGSIAMTPRAEARSPRPPHANPAFDPDFNVRSCELLQPPAMKPVQRIVVVGDTGCRIKVPQKGKGDPIQDCRDPAVWPWPRIAIAAAKLQPDLVIHVGDYHYRESCDDPARCTDLPATGYGWPIWQADFFEPGRPLLEAAPWIMVRGNHENCDRAGEGWMRFLAPGVYRMCGNQRYKTVSHSTLGNNQTAMSYRVPVDAHLSIAIADNAAHEDYRPAAQSAADAAVFAETLEPLRGMPASTQFWFLSHRPIWYELIDNRQQPNAFQEALRERLPDTTTLALAGHQHSFTTYNFAGRTRPPQVIVGNSGTQLESFDPESPLYEGRRGSGSRERNRPDARLYDGVPASSGINLNRYGFLLLEREGSDWSGRIMNPDGQLISPCRLDTLNRAFDCGFPAQ